MLHGSCHCGAVKFEVDATPTEATTCDCSLCVKKNARMVRVPAEAMTILEGEDALSLYQWNTGVARHYFCRRCGIYTFHRKRSDPTSFGVNIFCLDDLDPATVPVVQTEGESMTVAPDGARAEWKGPRMG
jgi:hypothetical protein